MDIDHEESVALRVSNPNQLELIIQDNIQPSTDGFLHAYVSNGGTALVHFDNFLISQVKGKVRQFNDYGSPCAIAPAIADGLSIASINGVNGHYKNKYTSKELQTGEFPAGSGGLEMFDFEARFYDPQLGRWFTPDPARQFSNPYLAMGNNPVMYVDPDGREIITAAIIIGAAIGAYIGGSTANDGDMNPGNWNWQSGHTWAGMGIGAVVGGAGGYGFAVAGPALAGTAFFANFGLSGAAAAYTIAGGVSMGVAGYGAGFGSAMARSKGNWNYGHQAGMFGMKVGASIGSFAGGIYGLAQGADYSMPEYEAPKINWNQPLTASTGNSGYGLSNNRKIDIKLAQILGNPYEESFYQQIQKLRSNIDLGAYSINSASDLSSVVDNYNWSETLTNINTGKTIAQHWPNSDIVMARMEGLTRTSGSIMHTQFFGKSYSSNPPAQSYYFGFGSFGDPQIGYNNHNTGSSPMYILNNFQINIYPFF